MAWDSGPCLPYLGIPLAAVTIYDLLAWLLSVTTRPTQRATGQVVEGELRLYIPLLAMYAKWGHLMSLHCTADRTPPPPKKNPTQAKLNKMAVPEMVSIAWFDLS